MLLLTFPMNLIGCGLNDIYDYESDRRSPRRRAVWGAVVSAEERPFVFERCLAMMPLVILGACLTRNWENFMATVSLVLVAWLYSVPPYRLKERPPLDSLANGLGYFLLPLMMGYSLNADPRTMPLRYYLLALCVAGVHALATAADYEADRGGRASHAGRGVWPANGGGRGVCRVCRGLVAAATSTARPSARISRFARIATLAATLLPRDRVVIAAACVTIFAGFLDRRRAAHLAGILKSRMHCVTEIVFATRAGPRTRTHCPTGRAAGSALPSPARR